MADRKTDPGPGAGGRPDPMRKERIIAWLVDFSQTDAAALAGGRPGDLPNLVYELRQWLDLEPDEPLNVEVGRLEKNPARLQPIINALGSLVEAVADRKRFQTAYGGGKVILDAGKLGTEGGRALSYRDARLIDAVLRVAIDDIYEDTEAALRIQRCEEPECLKVFYADRKNQKYCGHRCANKVASRTYRESHRVQRAGQERARYRQKVRQRTGPRVKVGRVPP
ncbi:MAG TPA: CGNR zinc finger domain-containing protein [Candidatus Binataceae bacterium]